MNVQTDHPRFLENLFDAIDKTTQVARREDIDVLIEEISKINFEKLSEEHVYDKEDKAKFKKIKYVLMVSSVGLAVAAVVASVVSIFFSAGTISGGALAVAAVSGLVSITTSFKQLDKTIERFISYFYSEYKGKTRFEKLQKKITNVSNLINKRVDGLINLKENLKITRANEILNQINRVNEFIKQIKTEVPEKIMKFNPLDPSPLLNHVGQE